MDPQGNGQRNGCLICTEPAENVYLESADEALKPSISDHGAISRIDTNPNGSLPESATSWPQPASRLLPTLDAQVWFDDEKAPAITTRSTNNVRRGCGRRPGLENESTVKDLVARTTWHGDAGSLAGAEGLSVRS
ncbi:uncharacterized protein RHO25_012360 [Cercospora beticola]|uniref:Uncharacterized protein n=1 Tax=Cercospora beticola TaxID=122368 RepID=A0ABZ0P8A0_CERBT|nr:hypothetical protein RHO25_012360 [Cercospora beticola]